jgi:hypothetical protein
LLSNNPALFVLAVVFTVGAVMFAAGSVLIRRTREAPGETIQMLEPMQAVTRIAITPAWTAELTGSEELVEPDLRIDMVERLAMIGQTWCITTLEHARSHDPDELVRDAADNALLVIAARS